MRLKSNLTTDCVENENKVDQRNDDNVENYCILPTNNLLIVNL